MKKIYIVALILVLGFQSVGAHAFEPLFNAPIRFNILPAPYSLCAFDFNADGYTDVAIGRKFYSTPLESPVGISICFSNGDGTFQSPTNYELGEVPESINIMDLDNDGVEDIVATKHTNQEIAVLHGHGDGTFEPPVFHAAGYAKDCCFSDFDGDGDIDIAIADDVSENILIMFNDGSASFTDTLSYGMDDAPRSICTNDFDNDGDSDIAVGQYSDVSILLNNGDGTFQHSFTFREGNGLFSMASDDFNQDGINDLVVLYSYPTGTVIMSGLGNGEFMFQSNYLIEKICLDVCLSDVDADGEQDLVVSGSGVVYVLIGRSDGTFGPLQTIGIGATINSICIADFDGDGDDDIYTGVYTIKGFLGILVNLGHGVFCDMKYYNAGADPTYVIVSEFNGDGLPDLAVRDDNENETGIFLNNGDGTLQDRVSFSTPWMFYFCATDVDGDGDNDLVYTKHDSLWIYLNDGGGNMQPGFSCRASEVSTAVSSADFDKDGDNDLAVGGQELSILMKKDGTLDYVAPQKYSSGGEYPSSLSICDFNKDGFADLAVANSETENIAVLLNDRNGRFPDPVTYYAGSEPTAISTSDLDGDGNNDIIVVNKYTDSLRVFLGEGDGTFREGIAFFAGTSVRDICIADFDNDGDIDITAYCYYPSISVLLNQGDATFQQLYYLNSGVIKSFCAADINGDMRNDIIVATEWAYVSSEFYIIENIGNFLTPVYRDPPCSIHPGIIKNYPNPFNPVTTIRLTIPRDGRVKLVIYDVNGRSMAVLADRFMKAGESEVLWDGKGDNGLVVSSGVYFARMTINGQSSVRKIVLLR